MDSFVQNQHTQLIKDIYHSIITKINRKSNQSSQDILNQFFGTTPTSKNNEQITSKKKQRSNSTSIQSQQDCQIINPQPKIQDNQTNIKHESNLLKNTNSISNIHLRHMMFSFLKSQCKKLQQLKCNYSSPQAQSKAKQLVLNLFLKYSLIFQELESIKSSDMIKKQVKKSFANSFVEILSVLFKKGFRKMLTVMKMIIQIFLISSYLAKQNASYIKKQCKIKLDIHIDQMIPQHQKLCYQMSFKLQGIQTPVNFNFQEQKKRQIQEKRKKKQQKENKLKAIKQKLIMANQPKNIKIQAKNQQNHIGKQIGNLIRNKLLNTVSFEKSVKKISITPKNIVNIPDSTQISAQQKISTLKRSFSQLTNTSNDIQNTSIKRPKLQQSQNTSNKLTVQKYQPKKIIEPIVLEDDQQEKKQIVKFKCDKQIKGEPKLNIRDLNTFKGEHSISITSPTIINNKINQIKIVNQTPRYSSSFLQNFKLNLALYSKSKVQNKNNFKYEPFNGSLTK